MQRTQRQMLPAIPALTLNLNPYSLALLGVGLIAAALALFSWSRRPAPGAGWLAWLMLAVALWAGAYGLELASLDLATMHFWVRVEYPGIVAVPPLWLLFALHHTGRAQRVARPIRWLLWIMPVTTLILNYSNEWHHLYYTGVRVERSGPFLVMALDKGPWYWVNAAYGYLIVLAGSLLLLRHAYGATLYRRQAWVLVLAALAPIVSNVLYQLGLTPLAYLDLTPFAFLVTGFATAWSLYRLHLFDVTPIARDLLIENLRDGMLVLDAQGRITDFNPAAQHFLGLERNAVGQAVEHVRSAWPGLAAFCANPAPARTEITLEEVTLEQRTPRYLEVEQSSLVDRRGRFAGTVLVLRDMTEHNQAEADRQAHQLAEAAYDAIRQLFDTLFDTVDEGLVLLDAGRHVVMANRLGEAHLRLLLPPDPGAPTRDAPDLGATQRSVTTLGGLPFAELLHPPAGLPHYPIRLDQPTHTHFELALHPLQQRQLEGGWLLVTRDVTRTRQIQLQMDEQERLAAVGQLAAGIAHDFNNILAVIVLYTDLLQRSTNLLPKQQRQLEVVGHQAHHAGQLVQQILDFSRKNIIARTKLDLAYFLQKLVELWRRTLPETIQVEFQVEPGPAYLVEADADRLQQALVNLAINARDAMPGGGTLRVELSRLRGAVEPPLSLADQAPDGWIVLRFADNGTGIDPAILPHVFEPFFTTKEPGKGTGLGLAQVFGIIKQHDGEIGVESQPGQGTTFSLYLRASLASTHALASSPVIADAGPTPRGQETILVVEDQDSVREALRDLLSGLGYRVLCTGDGEEALQLVEESDEPIDLVLSDVVMPRLGGIELYQALKAKQPALKLILLTGYPLDEEGWFLLEHERVPRLQKPCSAETLVHTIRSVLADRAG